LVTIALTYQPITYFEKTQFGPQIGDKRILTFLMNDL
jgi:hypothetical protein